MGHQIRAFPTCLKGGGEDPVRFLNTSDHPLSPRASWKITPHNASARATKPAEAQQTSIGPPVDSRPAADFVVETGGNPELLPLGIKLALDPVLGVAVEYWEGTVYSM